MTTKPFIQQLEVEPHAADIRLAPGRRRRRLGLILAAACWLGVAGSAIGNGAILEPGPVMSVARMGHYIVQLPDSRVALLGGHGTGFSALNSMDLWTLANNSCVNQSLPFVYDMGALIPLADGTYLMAGGAADWGVAPGYASAQLLSPTSATVASTGTTMNLPRMRCKGAQLTGGSVLIVGGWYDYSSGTYGEIYTPSNKAFAATGALNSPRSLPLVFPTSDGKAVVVGGTDIYGSSNIPSIELYDPGSNTFTVLAACAIAGEPNWVYGGVEYGEDVGRFKTSDGRYVFLMWETVNTNTEYALAFFDPASKQFSKLALTPVFWNNLAVWPPVVDAANNRVLMLAGASPDGGADATFRVYQADLATGETLALSDPLTISNYYPGSVATTLLRDGRLFVTGGTTSMDYNYNFNPVPNTFFLSGLNPPPQIKWPVLSSRTVSFTICCSIGYSCQIQSVSSLNTSNHWQTVDCVTLTNSTQVWTDPVPFTNSSRFYRLVQTTPPPDPVARPFRPDCLVHHLRLDGMDLPDSKCFRPEHQQPVADRGQRDLDELNPNMERPGASHQFKPFLPLDADKPVMEASRPKWRGRRIAVAVNPTSSKGLPGKRTKLICPHTTKSGIIVPIIRIVAPAIGAPREVGAVHPRAAAQNTVAPVAGPVGLVVVG